MLCRMLPAAADSIFWCLVPASGKKYCPHSTLQRQNGAQAVNLLASPLLRRTACLHRMYRGAAASRRAPVAGDCRSRQRARMVAKILRGAKPTDIPIEQATHFELVVNLQTAQAIGHDVPPGLVLRADKVIE